MQNNKKRLQLLVHFPNLIELRNSTQNILRSSYFNIKTEDKEDTAYTRRVFQSKHSSVQC